MIDELKKRLCDTVLDNAAGSLGIAEACNNTGRIGIAIEKDPDFFQKGLTRFKL